MHNYKKGEFKVEKRYIIFYIFAKKSIFDVKKKYL